jgi:hypothetical protein
MIAKGLHRQDPNPLFDANRHDILTERPEVSIHHINRHLRRIKVKAMSLRNLQHAQVHRRVLMTGKANVSDLASLPGRDRRFDRPAFRKDAVGVLHAYHFVKLDQIDHVGLKPPQRLFQLLVIRVLGPPIHLCHEKDFCAITIAERMTHPHLA